MTVEESQLAEELAGTDRRHEPMASAPIEFQHVDLTHHDQRHPAPRGRLLEDERALPREKHRDGASEGLELSRGDVLKSERRMSLRKQRGPLLNGALDVLELPIPDLEGGGHQRESKSFHRLHAITEQHACRTVEHGWDRARLERPCREDRGRPRTALTF